MRLLEVSYINWNFSIIEKIQREIWAIITNNFHSQDQFAFLEEKLRQVHIQRGGCNEKEHGVWSPEQLGFNLDSIVYYLCDLDLHEPQSPQE